MPYGDNQCKIGRQRFSCNAGFTLIELSIVIVIIGLVIGGLVFGRDLIAAARRHAEVRELGKYQAAYNTFLFRYECVPGDCVRASTFGLGHNGDGNGKIDAHGPLAVYYEEYVFAWEHLSKARLIEGSYDGNYVGETCSVETCPSSKLAEGVIYWLGGAERWWSMDNGAVLYGLSLTATNDKPAIFFTKNDNWDKGSFSVQDVFYLDTKLDDGKADRGRFITINDDYAGGDCVTGDMEVTDGTADYNLSSATKDCYPSYFIQ